MPTYSRYDCVGCALALNQFVVQCGSKLDNVKVVVRDRTPMISTFRVYERIKKYEADGFQSDFQKNRNILNVLACHLFYSHETNGP